MPPIRHPIRSLLFFASFTFSSLFAAQKVALFNDTSDWYHWGCTGTSLALKQGITDLGYELTSIPIQTCSAIKEVPIFERFDHPKAFERFARSNPEIIATIEQADAIVITGEGTLHELSQNARILLYIAHISKKQFSKHVEIINHSAYPRNKSELLTLSSEETPAPFNRNIHNVEAIYAELYSELDFIAIREPISLRLMQNCGLLATLSFDCLPLYITQSYQPAPKQREPILLLSGSITHNDEGVETLCRYAETMAQKGFKIQLLIGAAASPAKDDLAFVARFKSHCHAPWSLIEATSLSQWLDTINQASLLVSGRFHHSIAAYCLQTPFIAFNSNTPKIDAICSFLEQATPLHFSQSDLLEKLLERTNHQLSSTGTENQTKIDELCQLAEKNLDGLRSFLKHENQHPL